MLFPRCSVSTRTECATGDPAERGGACGPRDGGFGLRPAGKPFQADDGTFPIAHFTWVRHGPAARLCPALTALPAVSGRAR